MNEYSLTWDEAKEAMKRGAVVQNLVFENVIYSIDDVGNIIAKNPNVIYFLDEKQKWKIVELTDCQIWPPCTTDKTLSAICKKHECYVLRDKKGGLYNKLKQYCIQKFTKQLKEDMKKQAEFKACHDYYLKLQEQKMKEPKTYSFEESTKLMRQSKFMKSILYRSIYKVEHDTYYSWNSEEKKWHGVTFNAHAFDDNFVEVENPEKKEPENTYNEIGISEIDSIFPRFGDNEIMIGGNKFYTKENLFSDKWRKALKTFLRLKAHPLAATLVFDKYQYAITGLYGNDLALMSDSMGGLNTNSWIFIFNSNKDRDKAIEDIGRNNIAEMFRVFSGDYE